MSGRRSRVGLWAVALGLCLVTVVAVLVSRLETFEETVIASPTGEALRNPLLAAQRLFERSGIPAVSARDSDDLPPLDHLLILAAEDRILTAERAARVTDWVRRGGSLIVGPHLTHGQVTRETHRDPLLAELGVAVEEFSAEEGDRQETPLDGIAEETLIVSFPSWIGLGIGDDEDWLDLVRLDHGEGCVIVLSDLQFAHNDRIGDLDHAAFLLALARECGVTAGVRLVHAERRQSLFALLLGRAWPALLGGLVLTVAAVVRAGFRFGPRERPLVPGSRSLVEHVDAVGRFLWRHKRSDVLLDAARGELLRKAGRFRPGLARLSVVEQAAWLAARTGLARDEIAWALGARHAPGRASFTRVMNALQRISGGRRS